MPKGRALTGVAVAFAAVLILALGGCRGGASNPAAASAAAASACQKLINLEQSIVNKDGPGQASAADTLSSVQTLGNQAARQDPRWKRLDADITVVHQDLDAGVGTGLSSALTDVAGICSPAETPASG